MNSRQNRRAGGTRSFLGFAGGRRAELGCYCKNFVGFWVEGHRTRALFLRGDIFNDGVFVGSVFVDDSKRAALRRSKKKQNQFRDRSRWRQRHRRFSGCRDHFAGVGIDDGDHLVVAAGKKAGDAPGPLQARTVLCMARETSCVVAVNFFLRIRFCHISLLSSMFDVDVAGAIAHREFQAFRLAQLCRRLFP